VSCKLEHFHGGESNRWASLFLGMVSRNRFNIYAISLVVYLTLWIDVKVKNTLVIEESDEHYLLL
jgi:hypothetical protein